MPNSSHVLPDRTGDGFRARLIAVLSALVVANILAWVWTLAAFAGQPVLVGTAVLAYTLGLRHALDADHIAAIDNVTRKLMQEGQRPVAVGLFFALGHSAVVLIASVAIALAATSLTDRFAAYREIGGVIGTSASALFLFVIAISNLIVLFGLYRAFRRVRRGAALHEDDINALLQQRGWLARLFRPLFRFVSKRLPWRLLVPPFVERITEPGRSNCAEERLVSTRSSCTLSTPGSRPAQSPTSRFFFTAPS